MRIDDRYHGFDQPGGNVKIGNVALPRFDSFYFNTKTPPAMSDEKYREAIVAQAQKDAAAGKFQTESNEYKKLMKSYVSVASPDRKAIITNGLHRLSGVSDTLDLTGRKPNLIDILFGNTEFTEKGRLSYAEFKADGKIIAKYANGGWTLYPTDAENARTSEFLQIYNDAWRSAHRGKENSLASNGDDPVPSFDKSV
ncbi:MAG: hypothetical protein LBO81_05755 [Clostridiales Family XIII bacterium]|nr:hypothetical protein [Clostridiales Family XIII bacterium]